MRKGVAEGILGGLHQLEWKHESAVHHVRLYKATICRVARIGAVSARVGQESHQVASKRIDCRPNKGRDEAQAERLVDEARRDERVGGEGADRVLDADTRTPCEISDRVDALSCRSSRGVDIIAHAVVTRLGEGVCHLDRRDARVGDKAKLRVGGAGAASIEARGGLTARYEFNDSVDVSGPRRVQIDGQGDGDPVREKQTGWGVGGGGVRHK